MIFQFYHLLPELTTLENVLAPLMIAEGMLGYLRHRGAASAARHANCSRWSGCAHRLKHKPARAFRRRNAAGRDRPGADRRARRCCWPTSRRATSTTPPARRSCDILRTLNRQRQSHYSHGDARSSRSPRRPTASSAWPRARSKPSSGPNSLDCPELAPGATGGCAADTRDIGLLEQAGQASRAAPLASPAPSSRNKHAAPGVHSCRFPHVRRPE